MIIYGGTTVTDFRHTLSTTASLPPPNAANAATTRDGAWIDHPSGYLALSLRNRRFELPGEPGFIAYREQGKHLIAFGGVHAPPGNRGPLLDGFIAEATRRGKVALFVQIREDAVPLFLDRGMNVNQCGASISLELKGFSLAGARKLRIRRTIKNVHKAGIRTLEIGVDLPSDAAVFAQLHAITRAWIAEKNKSELDFMVGEIGTPDDSSRRIFIAVDGSGRTIGFVTCVPAWGRMPGYLLDLARCLPDAPIGTMDAIIADALRKLMQEGAQFAHFGFAPFVFRGEEYPHSKRIVAWLGRMLWRYGRAIYPAESQLAYKMKWGPEIVDREFIAAAPLSLRAVFDLLRLTKTL